VLLGDTIYTISGQNTINLSSVERAEILDDGFLSDWTPETPLNIPRRAASSVAVGDTIYTVGGMFGPMGSAFSIDTVESASVKPGRKLGNFVDAESPEMTSYRAWKEAVSIPFDAQSHLQHAREYLMRKDFEVVLFDIAEVIKLSPDNYEAYNLRGDVYYRMGNVKEAEAALRKSLDIKEDNFDALIGLGTINFERGDLENAIIYYKKGIMVNADSIAAHENLGNAYLSGGDYAAAAQEFQWVVDKDPGSEHAKLLLEMSMKSHKTEQNKANKNPGE
jgi:tetratricopeptide (TPR) repeat protein